MQFPLYVIIYIIEAIPSFESTLEHFHNAALNMSLAEHKQVWEKSDGKQRENEKPDYTIL